MLNRGNMDKIRTAKWTGKKEIKVGAKIRDTKGRAWLVIEVKGSVMTLKQLRVYGRWAGNERGVSENIDNCIADVESGGRSMITHQCTRKRGLGKDNLYCKTHAKIQGGGPRHLGPELEE